jgi:4-amino-4-deoxy-L-arabinose transferase-like glycosyltransferase
MLRRLPDAPRDLDGLPIADPLEERIARRVALGATVWFALVACWELFGPILAGHYAAAGGMGIIADNMLRWKIAGPVWDYTLTRPTPAMYYCHHPWGTFWTTALLMKVFGRHDFVCRLPAVLLSAATPPLLYGIGRAVWRPVAGAAAAVAFVVLPITLAFANFNALEVPVIAWSLLGMWGFVRLTQTGRLRHLGAALAGTLLALNADWPAFVLAGAMLGFGLVRGFLAPGVFGRLAHPRRYMQWWALAAAGSVLTFAMYVVVFKADGKLDDLMGAYAMRSSGSPSVQDPAAAASFFRDLQRVLDSRRYWIELSFSPIGIALGKAALVLVLVRLAVLRREHDVLPLGVLLMAGVQYVVFKQGADIHVFWPQYFGAYFALAMGAIVATLAPLLARVPQLGAARGPVLALGLGLVPLAAIARDGLPALVYARESGGRFNEKGLLIHSDGAKTAFLHFIEPSLLPRAPVEMHEGMKVTWAQTWALPGRVVAGSRNVPTRGKNAVFLADTRFLLSDLQGQIAKDFAVTAVGPFWKVASDAPAAPIEAYSFREREPAWWEWYLVSGTEPHRDIVPDPFLTWELRTHFGQPAEVPTEAPVTFDQKRIAHNIALSLGDTAKAAALFAEIERELTPVHAAFDDGTEIVGTTFHEGARSLLTILLRAGGPTTGDVQLAVKSKVTQKAAWSTTMADPTDRDVTPPLALAPQRWKKGFLYADPVAIRKRPGTEVFRAVWWSRGGAPAPRRVGGGARDVELMTLR